MAHINLVPLNPTGGFEGSSSEKNGANEFSTLLLYSDGSRDIDLYWLWSTQSCCQEKGRARAVAVRAS